MQYSKPRTGVTPSLNAPRVIPFGSEGLRLKTSGGEVNLSRAASQFGGFSGEKMPRGESQKRVKYVREMGLQTEGDESFSDTATRLKESQLMVASLIEEANSYRIELGEAMIQLAEAEERASLFQKREQEEADKERETRGEAQRLAEMLREAQRKVETLNEALLDSEQREREIEAEISQLLAEGQLLKKELARERHRSLELENEVVCLRQGEIGPLRDLLVLREQEIRQAEILFERKLADAELIREDQAKELEALRLFNENLAKELSEVKVSNESAIKELFASKFSKDDFSKELSEAKQRNSKLEKELLDSRQTGEQLEKELIAMKISYQGLTRELSSLKQERQESSKESSTTQLSNQNLFNELADLKLTRDELERELSVLQSSSQKMSKELSVVQTSRDDLFKELSDLKQLKDELERELSSVKLSRDELEKELFIIKHSEDDMEKELSFVKLSRNEIEKELSFVKLSNKELEKELSAVRLSRDGLQKEICSIKNSMNDLEKEFCSVKPSWDELNEELSALKLSKNDLEKEIASMKVCREALERELSSVKLSRENLAKELATKQTSGEELAREVSNLRLSKEELTRELSAVKEEKDNFAKELEKSEELQRQLSEANKKLSEKENVNEAIEELRKVIRGLSDELRNERTQNKSLLKAHTISEDSLKEKLAALSKDVQSKEQQLAETKRAFSLILETGVRKLREKLQMVAEGESPEKATLEISETELSGLTFDQKLNLFFRDREEAERLLKIVFQQKKSVENALAMKGLRGNEEGFVTPKKIASPIRQKLKPASSIKEMVLNIADVESINQGDPDEESFEEEIIPELEPNLLGEVSDLLQGPSATLKPPEILNQNKENRVNFNLLQPVPAPPREPSAQTCLIKAQEDRTALIKLEVKAKELQNALEERRKSALKYKQLYYKLTIKLIGCLSELERVKNVSSRT